ncbi:MAG: hypothetical protein CMC71_03270, partial [Flavobacteriaceae bacterium]|nr:hypothetical protein [Flavobacteriaceae bacterium]
MKKILLLIITFSLVACSGDNDNNNSNSPSQSDLLSIGGTDYELDSGNLTIFGPSSATDAV